MFVFTPTWTPRNIVLYIFLTALALAIGPLIYKTEAAASGRLKQKWTLPTRVAMLCLYAPPIFIVLALSVPVRTTLHLVQTMIMLALLGHFTKRCLEALFVHKYSARTSLATTIPIAAFYTSVAGMGAHLALQAYPPPDLFFWLGLLLFLGGEGGNFSHHKLLADLRKDSMVYVMPRGNLFDYVACPHYLFELIAWFGIILMSRHLFMLIAWVGMLGFLTARALSALNWYRATFPDFPKNRKALIPFVL